MSHKVTGLIIRKFNQIKKVPCFKCEIGSGVLFEYMFSLRYRKLKINCYSIFPSVEIVTTFHGRNFPLFISACLTAFWIPPQQGTSIRTTVTL